MPAVVANATQAAMPALTMDTFKGAFDVRNLIDKIAVPVLDQQAQARGAGGAKSINAEASLQMSLQATKQLSEQFERSLLYTWLTCYTLVSVCPNIHRVSVYTKLAGLTRICGVCKDSSINRCNVCNIVSKLRKVNTRSEHG